MLPQNTVAGYDNPPFSRVTSNDEDFSEISIKVFNRPEEILDDWRVLEKFALSPFSCSAWSNAWYDAHKNSPNSLPVIIFGQDSDHQPAFILPLFRKRIGPANILVRPGLMHSAYFGCLFSPELRKRVTRQNASRFWSLVFAAIPDIDAVLIDGVSQDMLEQENPLKYLPLLQSGNPSYRQLIKSNWIEQYKSMNNAKTRSNDRRCEKRLCELGTLDYRVAADGNEKRQFLADLLAQKSEQFKAMKIINPFEKPATRAFYEMLIESDERHDFQSIFISTLRLDCKPLAVNLGIIHGNVLYGLIISMSPGPFKRYSPGRLLLLRTNQYLSETGIGIHDFGVGDSSFKKDWCEQSINRFYVLAPLGVKGSLLVRGIRLVAKLKGLIKRSDLIKKISLNVMFKIKR